MSLSGGGDSVEVRIGEERGKRRVVGNKSKSIWGKGGEKLGGGEGG